MNETKKIERISYIEKLYIYEYVIKSVYDYCDIKEISLMEFYNQLRINQYPDVDKVDYIPDSILPFELLKLIESICKLKNISMIEYQTLL